jgi:hypothetical protein
MVTDYYDSSQADTRLFVGDQGSGKTCSAVACVVDDCYSNLNGIVNPLTGEFYKARPLNENEQKLLLERKVIYHPLKHIRVFGNNGTSKIVDKTRDCKGFSITSPVKVFCNFKLYGIRYRYMDEEVVVENVNSDTMTNAWCVFDEGFLTDKHETMSKVSKIVEKFGAQGRRRKLHTILISQYPDMIQSRWIRFATTRVLCTYDKDTNIISLDVKGDAGYMQSVDYYAPDYWKFYKHDELVKVPQRVVDSFMADAYKK